MPGDWYIHTDDQSPPTSLLPHPRVEERGQENSACKRHQRAQKTARTSRVEHNVQFLSLTRPRCSPGRCLNAPAYPQLTGPPLVQLALSFPHLPWPLQDGARLRLDSEILSSLPDLWKGQKEGPSTRVSPTFRVLPTEAQPWAPQAPRRSIFHRGL